MANEQRERRYEIGTVGLGVMARDFLLDMAEHGFAVAGYDKDPAKFAALRQESKEREVRGAAGDNTARVIPHCSGVAVPLKPH